MLGDAGGYWGAAWCWDAGVVLGCWVVLGRSRSCIELSNGFFGPTCRRVDENTTENLPQLYVGR